MVDQPTPGVPVYVVKSIAGGRPRVLHKNLLLPLQGRMRQEEESNPDSDSEGEASETTKATCGRPRRVNPIEKTDASSLTRLPSPEHKSGDGDSSEDEECITLSTPVDIPASTLEEVEVAKQSTINEPVIELSSDIQTLPYQSIIEHESSKHESEQESESESDSDSSVPAVPRRSARSTKGIPPVHYGQVQIKKHHYLRLR